MFKALIESENPIEFYNRLERFQLEDVKLSRNKLVAIQKKFFDEKKLNPQDVEKVEKTLELNPKSNRKIKILASQEVKSQCFKDAIKRNAKKEGYEVLAIFQHIALYLKQKTKGEVSEVKAIDWRSIF